MMVISKYEYENIKTCSMAEVEQLEIGEYFIPLGHAFFIAIKYRNRPDALSPLQNGDIVKLWELTNHDPLEYIEHEAVIKDYNDTRVIV